MIYTFIAYVPKEHDKDLAWTYNEYMRLLPNDDDWACFIDHDAMFTTPNWYRQMERVIKENPEYSCFTVTANRVYAAWQVPGGVNSINHDITYHRNIGRDLQEANGNQVADVTQCADLPAPPDKSPLSGVVILYKKSVWKNVPFRPMEPKRLTGIDNLLHIDLRDKGYKVGLMCGIYVYHWHRATRAVVQEQIQVLDHTIEPESTDFSIKKREDKVDMDVQSAQYKISQCKGDFVIIGVPVPNDRQIDLLTCVWVEYQKRKSNMMGLYESTRFAAYGRNNVIHKTLTHLPGATHLFFVDKDVLPPVDAIERLLAHDKDIVVGATPIYRDEPCWSVMKYDPELEYDNIFTPVKYAELPDKLFRAHHFGATTVLIKRHVLEKMQYPWYEDVFAPGALLLGQDLYFTAKAKRMGFELWCDPTVKCEHIRICEQKTVFDKMTEEIVKTKKELINGKVIG